MLSGSRDTTARRPWRISAKLLIISSVVTVIGFSAICVNVMLDMRRGEEALARQTLENLATTIQSDVSRNVEIYDLSLKAVASNMLLPELATVSKPVRHLILFDHATTARHFGAIQVFDPEGTITVLKRDRTILMRRPFDLDIIGTNLNDRRAWKPDNLPVGAAYSGQGPVDPTPRLYVRSADSGPLFVVAGKPLAAVFALWQKEAFRIGAVVLALALFVLGSTLVLAREIGRRAEAERKLEEMATTDALTGLKNRRKFVSVIDVEWRRAMRQKAPVALLMIAAAHFKAYNATFGHQAGDQVLVGIAICISDSVSRAGDCAARYGGEEFAVLLPGTSVTDALT